MRQLLLLIVTISLYVVLSGCSRKKGEIDYVPDFTEMVQRGEIEQLDIVEDFEGKIIISGQRKFDAANSEVPMQFKVRINEFDADLEEFLDSHEVPFTFTSRKQSGASE